MILPNSNQIFILLLYHFSLFGSPKAALEVVKKVLHCFLSLGGSSSGWWAGKAIGSRAVKTKAIKIGTGDRLQPRSGINFERSYMVLHRWQRETRKFCHVSGCCCLLLCYWFLRCVIGRYDLLLVVAVCSWFVAVAFFSFFFHCVTAFFWLLHITHNVSLQSLLCYKQLRVTRWKRKIYLAWFKTISAWTPGTMNVSSNQSARGNPWKSFNIARGWT